MNTNTSQKEKCPWCFKGSSENKYCPYCGRLTGRVSDPILSQYKNSPSVKMAEIAEGSSFFIRFEHIEGFPVNIECDISEAKNISFKDKPTYLKDSITATKEVNASFEFCLKDYRTPPFGIISFKLNNGERNPNEIWEIDNFNTINYKIDGKVSVASSEWTLGSEFLFFSNKLDRQNISIYNPSSIDRDFVIESPNGYNIDSVDSIGSAEIPIEGYKNAVLSIKKNSNSENPTYWDVGNQRVELFELPKQKNTNRRKLRISFDLGAKTFSIRACWVGGNPSFGKTTNCEIEDIGGKYFSPSMIMDKTGREFYFSSEADERISNIKNPNLVPITGLKTLIRDFNERYSPKWTNEYLLSVLFSEVYNIIKRWAENLFDSVGKTIPVGFKFNTYFSPEYVFTYPVLESEEKTKRYKDIFKRAFLAAFSDEDIDESQICFISEPEAVFNYIILKRPDISATSSGKLFAVIDSGAGTTDLSVGKIKKEKGIITLTDIKSISLDLTEEQQKYYGINTQHFSGNLLDFIFQDVLEKNAQFILRSPAGYIYRNMWEEKWGSAASNMLKEKMNYAKAIKERFELNISNGSPVQVVFPTETVIVDYKAYGEKVIEPAVERIFSEENKKKMSDMNIEFREIGMVALVGGSNICRYLRSSIISKPSFPSNATKQDKYFKENDRLYSIVEGACLPIESLFKTSFATFTIKDESNDDKTIAIEGESILPQSFQRNVSYNESNIAILDLFAESSLWKGTKKIATAISKKSNFDSEYDAEEAIFEINIDDKKCICSDEKNKNICWNINIS